MYAYEEGEEGTEGSYYVPLAQEEPQEVFVVVLDTSVLRQNSDLASVTMTTS